MIKVLVVASKYLPEYSGPAVRISNLYHDLKERHELEIPNILTGSSDYYKSENYRQDGFDVRRIGNYLNRFNWIPSIISRYIGGVIVSIKTLYQLSKNYKDIDVIHIFGSSPVTHAAIYWAKLNGKGLIIELVNRDARIKQKLFGIFHKDISKRTCIVAISKELEERAKKGGVASYLRKMSKLLIDRGHGVTIISLDKSSKQSFHAGIKYISVSNILKLYKLSLVGVLINAWRIKREFNKVVKDESVNVVQIANLKWIEIFIPNSDKYKKIVRISTSRILYDQYKDNKNSLKSKISELGEVYIMKQSDYVYAPSKLMASYYSKTYDLDVDVIRPPLVSKSTINGNKNNYNLPAKYFLFFGSVSKRKGIEIVLESFQRTFNTVKDAELVIAGEVKETSIIKSIEKLPSQVRSNIHFLGLVEKPELLDIINGAHVAILPSLVDNLPNTAIESLTLRVPVVSCYGSSIDELIEDGKSGYLFQRDDIPAFSDILIKIWKNQHTCKKNQIEYSPVLKEMISDAPLNRLEYLCQ